MYSNNIHKFSFVTSKSENIDSVFLKEKIVKDVKENPNYVIRAADLSNKISFELSKHLTMRNSFNPIFYGSINENSDNVIVSGKFGFIKEVKTFLIASSIFLIGLFIFIVFCFEREPVVMAIHSLNDVNYIYVPWWTPCVFIIGFLILILLFVLISIALQKNKRKDILSFIEGVLHE